MVQQCACNQPHGFNNHIKNIAVVGAGGTVGTYIVRSLLTQGKHRVTAITRLDSKSSLPAGLHSTKKVDYNDHSALVAALQGQEVLIITMAATAAPDRQTKLIDAAVEAGVQFIMPNEYSTDYSNASLATEVLLGVGALQIRSEIEKAGKGKTHWIALTSSFWYEYSLGGSADRYGFNFDDKKLTLFDDGETKICTTTWEQSGEAVAKLFALRLLPDDAGDKSLTLSHFEDRAVLVNSFAVSQRDMFKSVVRVTGDKEGDWTITHESSKERYERGAELMKSKDRGEKYKGFVLRLYTRVFYPNGGGDFSKKVVNEQLGLLKEDLDGATRNMLRLRKEGSI